MSGIERITFSTEGAVTGRTLEGVAHTFGQRALVGGAYIEFSQGSFDAALAVSDVRAFWNHDTTLLLGRQSAGTVRLRADATGLPYAIDLPETSYADDLIKLIERGDVTEMSFGILPGETKRGTAPDGKRIILHTNVKAIFDISPVSLPAFGEGTSVALHAYQFDGDSPRSAAIRVRARSLGSRT